MKIQTKFKLESYFGLFGTLITMVLLITAAIITPNYNPLLNTISSIGEGKAKFLFSIAFIIAGCSFIPFYIYLERELVEIKEKIRKIATALSIIGCISIALVGVIPDTTYGSFYYLFHGIVAFLGFFGSGVYISLYSYLMYKSIKMENFEGPEFHKFLAYFGFYIGIGLLLLLFVFIPILEWIITFSIGLWIILTSIHLLKH